MKFCPNYSCVAFGRVVYTQSTRCVFCRWDLKPPRMLSETVDEHAGKELWTDPAGERGAAKAPTPQKLPSLRRTA